MNLLSIDWDYFFPDDPLWDWGHRESSYFLNGMWDIRAYSLISMGMALPDLSGEEHRFWDRIKMRPDAEIIIAESHAAAAMPRVRDRVTRVWSFDAHHDCGYTGEQAIDSMLDQSRPYQCDEWVLWYALNGVPCSIRYPRWKRDALEQEGGDRRWPQQARDGGMIDLGHFDRHEKLPVFDRVFLCRSGAWVPPWHDAAFIRFAEAGMARTRRSEVVGREVVNPLAERPFDADATRAAGLAAREFSQWLQTAQREEAQ